MVDFMGFDGENYEKNWIWVGISWDYDEISPLNMI